MCELICLVPSKNLSQEKTETKKKTFGTWQFSKIAVMVNFTTQKSKSKHLVCRSFLWWQHFLRNERKHFTHIWSPNLLYTKFMLNNQSHATRYLINYVFSPLQRWQTDSTIPANIDVMVNRFFLNSKGMSTVIYIS